MTYHQSKEYQQAMIKLAIQINPAYFITLGFHKAQPVRLFWAEKKLRRFDAMLDDALHGRRWATLPRNTRTRLLAIP